MSQNNGHSHNEEERKKERKNIGSGNSITAKNNNNTTVNKEWIEEKDAPSIFIIFIRRTILKCQTMLMWIETIICIGWNGSFFFFFASYKPPTTSTATTSTPPRPTEKKETHKENVCKCRNFNRGIEYTNITCLGKHVWITAITHSPHHYIDILPTNLYKVLWAHYVLMVVYFFSLSLAKAIFGHAMRVLSCFFRKPDPIQIGVWYCYSIVFLLHVDWLINWAALISSFGF